MQDDPRQLRTQQVIDDAERLIAKADAALAAGARFFAEQGITRETLQAEVRRRGLESTIETELNRTMEQVRQEAAMAHHHIETTPRPLAGSAKLRRMRNLI